MSRRILAAASLSIALGAGALAWAHRSSVPLPQGTEVDRLVVEKSAHRLSAFSHGTLLKTYSISLGRGHLLMDWTVGCMAVTDPEIEELYRAVRDGTPIEIRP